MIKCFCDRCGSELDGYSSPFYLEFKIKRINRHVNLPSEKTKIHLCAICSGKLNAWLEEGGTTNGGPND